MTFVLVERRSNDWGDSLPEGSPLEVAGDRGVVEEIGPIATVFRDGERTWSVPNTRLLDEIMRR